MLTYKINPKMLRGIDNNNVSTAKIDVPLQSNFALDMSQDLLSSEMFFEKIKKDVLPPVTDMEKIVVYPAVYYGESDGEPVLYLADEMEINMHFRQRWYCIKSGNRIITEGWSTNDHYEWTKKKDAETPGTCDTLEVDPNFDERSDLVGYLGFEDDDIYYQKSKVKKSFLRLMYYDSKDMLNKNLLTYSTSFMDSGKLFTKYSLIRNNKNLYKYVQESERYENEMVMFEPEEYGGETEGGYGDKYNNLRLTSAITLKDKYNDDASSDGFYIYLFKQDAPSERPIDLYLKAEFNNAKYGKTLNLMLPVRASNICTHCGKARTVDITGDTWTCEYCHEENEVADDEMFPLGVPIRFADVDFPTTFVTTTGEGEDAKTNFDFLKYYDSLFVNVKCKYEKSLKKYVYYFPWDPNLQERKMELEEGMEFTVSNDIEKRKITLNFFEPKLNTALNYTEENEP